MIELEVYAAGLRDLNKVLDLDHELEAIPGLRCKVDSDHDIVYPEREDRRSRSAKSAPSLKSSLSIRASSAQISPELRPKTKTQPLNV